MSNFNAENNMSYLDGMDEDTRVIFLKVLTRLARSDDKMDNNEKGFIKSLAAIYKVSSEHFADIVRLKTDDEIIENVKQITKRADKLQLIKEMCLLANSDSDLTDAEVILIGSVAEAMDVELEKVQQISQWVIDRIIWLEEGKIIFEKFES